MYNHYRLKPSSHKCSHSHGHQLGSITEYQNLGPFFPTHTLAWVRTCSYCDFLDVVVYNYMLDDVQLLDLYTHLEEPL